MAIDNDDWCIENASENIEKNGCKKIEIALATKPNSNLHFDIIIANINKHIILENISFIDQSVNIAGEIILSGLLIDDEMDIHNSISLFHWKHIRTVQKGDWIAIHFKKA